MASWTVSFNDGRTHKIDDDKLLQFRDIYIWNDELKSRISRLFLLELYVMDFENGISPNEILASIKEMENGELPTGVKPATPFRNPPLKGLWHKHFFAARFLISNIIIDHGKKGLEEIVNSVIENSNSGVFTKEIIGEIAYRATEGALENRSDKNRLTGEWIIYLPHNGKNYYLTIATHDAGDQNIYDRIALEAKRDFPEIEQWIASAAST